VLAEIPPPKFTPFPPKEHLLRQQGKLGASMEEGLGEAGGAGGEKRMSFYVSFSFVC